VITASFAILLAALFLLVGFGYAFSIFVYCRHASYRPAIIKGLIVWLILWALLAVDVVANRDGHFEGFEGAWWVGLPTTYPLELDFIRRALSFKTRGHISLVLLWLNWAGTFAAAAVVFKKIWSLFRRPPKPPHHRK